ncbi:hypothetical protein [Vibrio rarus]
MCSVDGVSNIGVLEIEGYIFTGRMTSVDGVNFSCGVTSVAGVNFN